jgi:hypothetical protein
MLAGSAIAASLAPDPVRMLLRKSDFPKSAKYTSGDVPANVIQALKKGFGIDARGAYVVADIPVSSTKSEMVTGSVYTTLNAGQARKVYAAFKHDFGGGSKLALPTYGDEQIALYKPGSSIANMMVRRNSVVWSLSVEGMGLLVIPKAQMIAEMKKYAAKHKARVGAG